MVSTMVEEMVDLWLALRDDPTDLKLVMSRINSFLKRADFETESAYYVRLHERYMDGWQSGNAAGC